MSLSIGRPRSERFLAMRVLLWATQQVALPAATDIAREFGMSLMCARRYRTDIANALLVQTEINRASRARGTA